MQGGIKFVVRAFGLERAVAVKMTVTMTAEMTVHRHLLVIDRYIIR
jgi:hypothetical protein